MIPRDKIRNITYGYANEGAGLTYTGEIRVDKASETLNMQLRMRSAYGRRWKQTTGNPKQCKSHLTKTTDMYMAIRYQHKICKKNVCFCLEAKIYEVLTRLRKTYSKKNDEPWHRPYPDTAGPH